MIPFETSLEAEREEQRRWRLHAEHARMTIFDQLLANEFVSEDGQRAWRDQAVQKLVRFAARVPYYRKVFADLGLTADDFRGPDDLQKLPLLTKRDVYEFEKPLRAKTLPRGEKLSGRTLSSGTTGRPTRVAHTAVSHAMFGYLRQRMLRSFRFDPSACHATIRLASQMPRLSDGTHLPDGVTHSLPGWQFCGTFFETGPAIFFNVTNPVDQLIHWLQTHRPRYLMTYPETLEHLVFAAGGDAPFEGLKAAFAVSEQLTPAMRRRIEGAFGCPVHQAYGLNEIGSVAFRCQAGRYHVHTEHCLVEIVDDHGRPCVPGAVGRIIVTGLNNPAMPLIRYDTDDMAEMLDGPCPCGRTLPSFGEVAGRYSRIAFLPEGTLGYVGAIREALEAMPRDLARNLRKFQVHQFRDNKFELRLLSDVYAAEQK